MNTPARSTFVTAVVLRVTFYTHISDRYAPFHTKVINATVRDATHVLNGHAAWYFIHKAPPMSCRYGPFLALASAPAEGELRGRANTNEQDCVDRHEAQNTRREHRYDRQYA